MVQGFEIVAYTGGTMSGDHRSTLPAGEVVKSWAGTYKQAEKERDRLAFKYDCYTEIRR